MGHSDQLLTIPENAFLGALPLGNPPLKTTSIDSSLDPILGHSLAFSGSQGPGQRQRPRASMVWGFHGVIVGYTEKICKRTYIDIAFIQEYFRVSIFIGNVKCTRESRPSKDEGRYICIF
jgi:hypothetical protein